MNKHVSLGEFHRRHGIHKGTVSKDARARGYDTSSGLSPEAYEAMCQEYGVEPWVNGQPPAREPETVQTEVLPQGFWQSTELAPVEERQINLPEGFNPAAMAKFFDGVTGEATDTASLVAIADLALNAVDTAMDEKLEAQRQKLNQSEKDAAALATKISEAKTRLQVKALESKMLAKDQTKATKSAEELFAELMAMGKSDAPDGGESPS